MKNKILFLTVIFAMSFVNISSSQTILFQNKEHVIHYIFSGENIVVTIEDINDYDNNLFWGKGVNGYTLRCNGQISVGYEGSCLEFDIDLNNKLEKTDKGYFKCSGTNDGKNVYYCGNQFYDIYMYMTEAIKHGELTAPSGSKIYTSEQWSNSNYALANEHPIWTFSIPIIEIMDFEKMKINVRAVISRCSSSQGSQVSPFVYPVGQTCNYSNVKFFTIDLTNTTNEVVLKVKKDLEDKKVSQQKAKEEASSKSKLYTDEAMKKVTSTLPKNDGVYIKLKSGKYLEVSQQKLNYGVTRLASKGSVIYNDDDASKQIRNGGYVPYYTQTEFETLQIIQIQKSDYVNFSVVASASLKTDVDFLSLHPINFYPLSPLPGGTYLLFPCDYGEYTYNRNQFVWTGKVLEGVNIYWFDAKLAIDKSPGDSWSYLYKLTQPLDVGFYGLWANKNIWIFQIIPDKPKTAKSTNAPKTTTGKTTPNSSNQKKK